MHLEELVDGVLRQRVGVADVKCLKSRKLARHHHFTKNLQYSQVHTDLDKQTNFFLKKLGAQW